MASEFENDRDGLSAQLPQRGVKCNQGAWHSAMRVETETSVQIDFTAGSVPDSLTVAALLSTQRGERGMLIPR